MTKLYTYNHPRTLHPIAIWVLLCTFHHPLPLRKKIFWNLRAFFLPNVPGGLHSPKATLDSSTCQCVSSWIWIFHATQASTTCLSFGRFHIHLREGQMVAGCGRSSPTCFFGWKFKCALWKIFWWFGESQKKQLGDCWNLHAYLLYSPKNPDLKVAILHPDPYRFKPGYRVQWFLGTYIFALLFCTWELSRRPSKNRKITKHTHQRVADYEDLQPGDVVELG